MNKKIGLCLVLSTVLVGLLGIALFPRGDPAPIAVPGTGADGAAGGTAVELEGGVGGSTTRAALPDERGAAAPPETGFLPPDDLRARLRRVARAEQDIFAAGESVAPALRGELEASLAPLLFHPELIPRILDLLKSGELRVRLDHLPAEERSAGAGRLGIEEYGAVRTLYWAILTYNASYGTVVEAGVAVDGQAVLMDILLALPDIEDPARAHLLTTLVGARLDEALVLDAGYLEEILRLRALFPAHEEVFSALLVAMGEGMSPGERTAFFHVFLPDTDDPVLMGVTLRNLLQGADPAFALWLAGERFDDAAATPEMRAAIASAVVDGAEDPFAAVEFLSERAAETAGMPALYLGLGWRGEEALTALDTRYAQLAMDGADPVARRLVVMGMGAAPPARLLEIARDDPDARVRGQALITLSADRDRPPTAEEVEALRDAYTGVENGIGVTEAMAAAANLVRRARAASRADLKGEVVSFLVNLAEDRALSPAARRSAVQELKGYIDELRLAELAGQIELEK